MHEIAQIYLPFYLSSTINFVFISMEDYHKGRTYLKMITRNSLNTKTKNEEKSARLKNLKDSLGKNKTNKSEKKKNKTRGILSYEINYFPVN